MEMTSRFDRRKGDAPDLYRKPLAGHWFPGNAGAACELNTAIPFLYLDNFTTAPACCVQTACRMDLFTKAKERGIQTEFLDGQGHRRVTDAAALKIIIDALPARSTPAALLGAGGGGPVRSAGADRAQAGCHVPAALENRCRILRLSREGDDRTIASSSGRRICRKASTGCS